MCSDLCLKTKTSVDTSVLKKKHKKQVKAVKGWYGWDYSLSVCMRTAPDRAYPEWPLFKNRPVPNNGLLVDSSNGMYKPTHYGLRLTQDELTTTTLLLTSSQPCRSRLSNPGFLSVYNSIFLGKFDSFDTNVQVTHFYWVYVKVTHFYWVLMLRT